MELAIKLEHFNANFLSINMMHFRRNNFSNIIYNSPTIILQNLIFPTPWMELLLIKADTEYFIDLSFNGFETNEELMNFFNCINDIDDFVIDFLHKHKYELNITYNNIDTIYTRQTTKRSPKHPPILRLNFPHTPIDITEADHYMAKSVIKCTGLHHYNGIYSLSWEIVKMNLKKHQIINDTTSSLYLFEEYNKEFIDNRREINEEEKKNINMLNNELNTLENNRNVQIT